MARSQMPIDVFVCRRLLCLLLPFCPRDKRVELLEYSCISYRLTNTHKDKAATKRLAKQKWEVMSHIWTPPTPLCLSIFLVRPGQSPRITFKTVVSGVAYQPVWIHRGQDGRLIFLAAKGLLFVSVRSNGCFSPSQRGPNVLEGDSDMVRYPCMLSLWVDSCPEAVCEALMVPHFHWIWCFGSCATDTIVFFPQQQKNNPNTSALSGGNRFGC